MRTFLRLLAAIPAVLAAPTLLEKRAGDAVARSWIVKLNQDSLLSSVLGQATQALGVTPTHTYDFGAFQGFSIDGVDDAAGLLANIASIASIEPNRIVTIDALTRQQNPPWGLGRISHRQNVGSPYIYDSSAGEGTFAYIVDTGIFAEHNDFNGRATRGRAFVDGEGDNDGNGHGTHVAGTIGSSTYGVAKKTHLIGVKVLSSDGSGTTAAILAGIDWAVNDAKSKGRIGKSVLNMSLGGTTSTMLNDGATEAVNQGMFLAVAAGNSGLPTITSSPASAPAVCTVGAADSSDARASFSNFGLLVDVFAPGVNVKSTWINNRDDTNTISGTSMASPHIAGLAAYLLGLGSTSAGRVPTDPQELCDYIGQLSTKNALSGAILSKNQLAYNGNGA